MILDRIARQGPIPFDVYMDLVLYDPDGGYFTSGPLRSHSGGDFLTSPEVSPEFGATLARYVEGEYLRLGAPSDFTLVEVGAGSGSLLEPLVEHLSFSPRVVAVEVSSAARGTIRKRLPHAEVVPPGGTPARLRGVVVANEVADNLPMAIAVREASGWTERWVGRDGGDLAFVQAPVRPEVSAWLDRFAPGPPEGGVVECQLGAEAWLSGLAERMVAGSILVIDYGDTAAGLIPRRKDGTLRTYRNHHLGPHPLAEPGMTDLTADVNFTALADVAVDHGLTAELERQHELLTRLGLRDRLAGLRKEELALARAGSWEERLVVRSRTKDIETLLHPRGLGDFLVLVAHR